MMYQGTKVGVRGLLSVCLAWALAACQTIDPYTGEQKTSNATKGAAVGAASGAVIGAIAGGDRKGAAIGAGVGLLAGAGVGHYMDQQEAKLRAQLQGTGVSVTRRGDNIILNMPGNVTFATGQADIRSDFYPVLDSDWYWKNSRRRWWKSWAIPTAPVPMPSTSPCRSAVRPVSVPTCNPGVSYPSASRLLASVAAIPLRTTIPPTGGL
jgi:hypothetical protein